MRLRKSDLTQRVNADLALRYDHEGLTSFAGLELLRRYFCQIRLRAEIRRCLGCTLPNSDFGVVGMVLVILLLIISGGRRLRHLGYLQGDPVVRRCSGLKCLPTPYSVGRWLAKFDDDAVDRLRSWNETVVARGIRACQLRRLTLDIDGSVSSRELPDRHVVIASPLECEVHSRKR